jgi:simple sugar transport system ATP-binding protein
LTGLSRLDKGSIILNSSEIIGFSPIKMLESGIGHIPEDRKKRGLVQEFSIKENLILGYQRKKQFSSRGVLNRKNIDSFAERISKQFNVKTESIDTPVSTLSGGNEQKVVIGRVLSEDPQVIIAAQPTRGVDIGAIEYIHGKLMELRDAGKAILLISAELDEIIKLSDRIAVIYEGQIAACDRTENFDEYKLGLLMTGGRGADEGRKTN